MSEAHDIAPIGHNNPPVALPKDEAMLADLQRRYPEIDKRLTEWDEAFKGYMTAEGKLPEIPLDQEDVAQNLQDLLSQVKKDSKVWTDSFQKQEKAPLNKLVKIVGNFFTGRVEKAEKHLETWLPVHADFARRKADKEKEKAEAAAAAEREKERLARLAAEKAAQEQAQAEAAAAAEREKERLAREAAEKAARDREEAEKRAEAAKAEEKRLADEKRVRDAAEKEINNSNLRDIRDLLREAEKLDALAEAEEATDDETAKLTGIIEVGGLIGLLARPVAASTLLDDAKTASLKTIQERLGQLRDKISGRANARERKRLAKLAAEQQKKDEAAAAVRKKQREEEDKLLAAATAKRLGEEALAAKAKEEKLAADKLARDARDSAKDLDQDAKAAGRDAKASGKEADRAGNRADRQETKIENSTDSDFGRVRGELGSVGSITERWKHRITDEPALRAVCGPLGPHLTEDALSGAAYRWMMVHRAGFVGERVEGALPGVLFFIDEGMMIS